MYGGSNREAINTLNSYVNTLFYLYRILPFFTLLNRSDFYAFRDGKSCDRR
jgi:hypothetical protein